MNMNIDSRVTLNVTSDAWFPQHLGFQNTIFIDLYNMIKELAEDQNGRVTDLGSYLATPKSCIELKPSCFCVPRIFECLGEFIKKPSLRQKLSEKIVLNCSFLPQPFLVLFRVKVTRKVRIMLPFVSVPSKAASPYVFQRLVQKQTVESIDLGEEEEHRTCSICMEKYSSESSSENIIRLPDCLHVFHQDCVFEWLRHHNSCPLCRCEPYKEVVAET